MTERKSKERAFEVLVSFDGLDRGERFSAADDGWSQQHVASGYLRDVTVEPTAAAAQGEQAPVAEPEKVAEARNAGEVRKG